LKWLSGGLWHCGDIELRGEKALTMSGHVVWLIPFGRGGGNKRAVHTLHMSGLVPNARYLNLLAFELSVC